MTKNPKVKDAMKHPDKLGAGAKMRYKLHLTPSEHFDAVMSEFKRGTLRSGSGDKVTNPAQAKVIAIEEQKAFEKRRKQG